MAQSRGTGVALPSAWPQGQQENFHGHLGRGVRGQNATGMSDLLWRTLVAVSFLARDFLSVLSWGWQLGGEDSLLKAEDPKDE